MCRNYMKKIIRSEFQFTFKNKNIFQMELGLSIKRKKKALKLGLPRQYSSKEFTCQCRTCKSFFDPCVRKITLEEKRATHSSILAWKIPWTQKPGGQQSMFLQTTEHDYYSAIKKNTFESVLMRWMKLELIIQSEISQKDKHQY